MSMASVMNGDTLDIGPPLGGRSRGARPTCRFGGGGRRPSPARAARPF